MHPSKINNIIKLNDRDRYEYTIREIVKHEGVWCVATEEGLATFVDDSGDEVFPVWPHKEVAELCKFEEFQGDEFFYDFMNLEELMDYVIPDFSTANVLFGVFYVENRDSICVPPGKFLEDLRYEIDGD